MEQPPTPEPMPGLTPGPEPEPLRVVGVVPPGKDGVSRIFELSDGSFAFIGTDNTAEYDPQLPPDAGRADYERIVTIPRSSFLKVACYALRRMIKKR
jgi:hypothetical protein